MGKKWFNKKKKKNDMEKGKVLTSQERFENRLKRENQDGRNGEGYIKLLRENENFEIYYKAQKLMPEEEWEDFLKYMKDDLPAAFRFTGCKDQSQALSRLMQESFQTLPSTGCKKPLKLFKLPWYPDGFGWQLNLTRKDIRREETYWKLHQFMISETETGNISRQEAVSMIPPLLLEVQSTHKVLDMCAAPGSKTAQIIEILHSNGDCTNSVPSGVVVANDVDNKRCYMLTHQAKRLQSPALIITNHDASAMPNIHYTRQDGSVAPMKYDRVLCDVPCSGDGTLRKNFDVWSKWNSVNGANLHGLQMRIARRGLELLTVGGRMVYSTCSLNPLENEAVVNRLLAEYGPSVSLVEVSEKLEGLKYIPGLENWTVMNKEMEVVTSPDTIPANSSNYLHPRLFPPTEDEKTNRNLQRCIRILPHHQDTGGFFLAVLEKNSLLPGEKVYKEESKLQKNNGEGNSIVTLQQKVNIQSFNPPPKKRVCRGFREEPFYYTNADDPIWETISSFYGIDSVIDTSLFLTRTNDGKSRNIYFTNSLVRDIVLQNESRIKIVNTGVKVLVRCDNKGSDCQYRLAQEGLLVLSPFLANRKLRINKDDMIKMLTNEDTDIPPQIEDLSQEMQNQCTDMECGSVIFVYDGNGFKDDISLNIQLVGWKGKNSVRCYVIRNERAHYLRLLGADISAFERNKFEIARKEEEEAAEQRSESQESSSVSVDVTPSVCVDTPSHTVTPNAPSNSEEKLSDI